MLRGAAWLLLLPSLLSAIEPRDKRDILASPPLVYPYGGTIKLLAGYALPIAMPGRIVVYGQNFQFQYGLPQNASLFSDYFNARSGRRRRRQVRGNERSLFYGLLEHELQRRGAPGKDCVRRSICEAAETPLHQDGLVGEILHVLLTPDYGGGAGDAEYRKAAEAGRRGDDCRSAYPACPRGLGILDHISTLFDPD